MIKALIVDDEYHNRKIVYTLLTHLGCDVMEVEDGLAAEQVVSGWQPDLIILDIMMPKQDGYQTCTNLRTKGYAGQIVMLTSLLQSSVASLAMKCGADASFTKPITAKELQGCISKCIV